MRQLDEFPLDPEIAAQLDAVDATLAGEPVDPEYAELAELALLVTMARPRMSSEFAATLDERLSQRFAPAPALSSGSGAAPPSRRRRIRLWPAAGAVATTLAGVIAVVVLASSVTSGGGSSASSSSASSSASSAAASPAPGPRTPRSNRALSPSTGAISSSSGASSSASVPAARAVPPATYGAVTTAQAQTAAGLRPPNNGRQIVQSAQLQLTAPPPRIDQVAQEAFDVVGIENGIVNRSSVTATGGPDAYAEFQLSVPSANLSDAMTRLSSLRYASIASRTDETQDVTNQYVSDGRRLGDDQALRTSLLKQLAGAATQTQIGSLRVQIHDAEAAISRDESTLNSLKHRIGYSTIVLGINAGVVPVTPASPGGGFTIGKALHDAGRVLTVAAGVALIALAALVPVGLVIALGLWIGLTLRRRRREQALDAA